MTTEDFAVQFLWMLIFLMVFVGSLCVLDVLFRPRRRRDYRMPVDFMDAQRKVAQNGQRTRMGAR